MFVEDGLEDPVPIGSPSRRLVREHIRAGDRLEGTLGPEHFLEQGCCRGWGAFIRDDVKVFAADKLVGALPIMARKSVVHAEEPEVAIDQGEAGDRLAEQRIVESRLPAQLFLLAGVARVIRPVGRCHSPSRVRAPWRRSREFNSRRQRCQAAIAGIHCRHPSPV
jgi:hypothetical protein